MLRNGDGQQHPKISHEAGTRTDRNCRVKTWRDKAQREITAMCAASYRQVNYMKNGRKRKRHVPYAVPALARDLVDCLGRDDEMRAKAIFLHLLVIPDSAKDF